MKVDGVKVETLPGSSDGRRFEVTVRVTLPEIEGLTVADAVRLTETWACRAADEIELEPRDGAVERDPCDCAGGFTCAMCAARLGYHDTDRMDS